MPDARGTAFLAPAELDRIVRDTVMPELGSDHTMAIVGTTTVTGVQLALLVRKAAPIGEFQVEACWRHDWGSDLNTAGARVIWKF